ncbi:hypothetical protein [Variovorax sp. CF079]|uniref:hypothetical protein n=1 Tax=Variovorax sp. CF079 TaxID=1882774 RepID=UPI0014811646|nr:hypothetical protein [Variovorax sp. CF079]
MPRKGGVILARSGERKELEADRFVQNAGARKDVTEFKPSMTAPGAEVLKEI